MTLRRRSALQLFALSTAAGLAAPAVHARGRDDDDDDLRAAKVFSATNAAAGNELLVFGHGDDGALSALGTIATGGVGTGAGLGNQGGVALTGDGRHLLVVNAGSHTVSTFRLRRRGAELVSVADAGGLRPVSVAEFEGVVAVLNADGAGNVATFRLRGGALAPIGGGTQPLSAAGGTAPAQVAFSDDGRVLIVTEKATNRLVTYRVGHDGGLGGPVVTPSPGMTPFGFAVDRRGAVLVSEAFGGAAGASTLTSYVFPDDTTVRPQVVSASVGSGQSAACWVVATPNGRFAYVTNTASGNVSRYAIGRRGQATLSQAVAAGTDAGPIDAAVSPDGRRLFVLNAGGRSIQSFGIDRDGGLTALGRVAGLPAGSNGLAAN